MNKYKKLIYTAIIHLTVLLTFFGCASIPPACEITPYGSLGKDINTVYDEYGPGLSTDTSKLFFTSTRGKEMEGGSEDLFIAEKIYSNVTEVKYLPAPASTGNNEGSPAFSKDGRFAILARSHYKDSTYGGTDLYSANVLGINFYNIHNLGSIVNTEYWDSQPALSSDGKTLIFASDRPGGLGGVDLWNTIKLNNNTWGVPVNLGPSINTSGNEYSPFLYDSEKETILFFASDGRKDSKGKLDIYYAFKKGEKDWYSPINMGELVNTNADELFPCPVKNLKELIYSSNNPSGCGGYDLYRNSINVVPPCIILTGTVVDSLTNKPLNIKANVKFINKETGVEINKNTSLPSSGYLIDEICIGNYQVEVQAANYFFNTYPFEITPSSKDLIHRLVPIPKDTKPIKVFDLREYNVPFFVTGYYRLNVPENLSGLKSLLGTKLNKADYIEKPGPKYDHYAQFIQKLFRDTIFTFVADSILPNYLKDKKQYLEIEIFGYADPRNISGAYLEDDINLENMKIKTGDNIDNRILSCIRAFYTKEYMDKELMKYESYQQIKKEGRIKFIIEGKGVDITQKNVNTEKDYDARRRIKINVWLKYFER